MEIMPEVLPPDGTTGSSSNLQFKAERIKIPSTPRYPRSVVGSDRGEGSLCYCPATAGTGPHPTARSLGTVWGQGDVLVREVEGRTSGLL